MKTIGTEIKRISDSFPQFHLVILDLMIPGTSKLDEGSVSVLRDEPAVRQCLEKPINISEFKSNVQALISKASATKV